MSNSAALSYSKALLEVSNPARYQMILDDLKMFNEYISQINIEILYQNLNNSLMQQLNSIAMHGSPVSRMILDLFKKKQLHILPSIIKEIQNLTSRNNNIAIETTHEITAAEKAIISKTLNTTNIQFIINKNLIGGTVIKLNDKYVIDMSLKTKLNKIKKHLSNI